MITRMTVLDVLTVLQSVPAAREAAASYMGWRPRVIHRDGASYTIDPVLDGESPETTVRTILESGWDYHPWLDKFTGRLPSQIAP